ncbi:MAG: glycosyltransferase [Prevotella sp.]|nr:glycosyltransferase [Prevotella sp.]
MTDYSVTIRTLGTAGEKYQRTLNSIAKQTIPPKEIIVVLAEGYPIPSENLGWEKFVYAPKGMVTQRIVGFNVCKSELLLALDDDVEFEPDFVASLIDTMQRTNADFVSPVVKEYNNTGGVNVETLLLIGF